LASGTALHDLPCVFSRNVGAMGGGFGAEQLVDGGWFT